MTDMKPRRLPLIIVLLTGAAVLPWLLQRRSSDSASLIVYCAHDAVFADEIIQRFESQTGIEVDVRYDEEANKSLGLTNLLLAEKMHPRCDVFWNNQTLGTIRLQNDGVLAACDPKFFARIPQQYRDPDHHWCGFAARLRVYIVNTDLMAATSEAIAEKLKSDSLADVVIAVPLFGTTLTHYTVLCEQLGLDALKQWHQSLHERGIREARGNGAVKDLVAEGVCALGFTDTDDAFAAIDAKKPVAMLPITLESGQTICIPNSVAMINGCPHPKEAAEFIQFLLSEETELALASSAARQIPLGPVDATKLPVDVRELLDDAANGAPILPAAAFDREVLDWLKESRETNVKAP